MQRNTRTVRCDRACNKRCRCLVNYNTVLNHEISGVALAKGSGATTDLSGPITTAGAAFFDDAVRLVGDTSIVTSGGDVTITGGTEGIYSQSGSSHNLSINAGLGDIVLATRPALVMA